MCWTPRCTNKHKKQIKHQLSYNQPGVKTNQTSFYADIVTDNTELKTRRQDRTGLYANNQRQHNEILALLQTTGGKDEPNIVFF